MPSGPYLQVDTIMFTNTKSGQKIFRRVCKALTAKDLEYAEDEENLQIRIKFEGDDLPIDLQVSVNEESTTIDFLCKLAFEASATTYSEVLAGLNRINGELRFGAFVLIPDTGWLTYRYAYIYADADPTADLILSLISMVVTTVDERDTELKKLIPVNTEERDLMFG